MPRSRRRSSSLRRWEGPVEGRVLHPRACTCRMRCGMSKLMIRASVPNVAPSGCATSLPSGQTLNGGSSRSSFSSSRCSAARKILSGAPTGKHGSQPGQCPGLAPRIIGRLHCQRCSNAFGTARWSRTARDDEIDEVAIFAGMARKLCGVELLQLRVPASTSRDGSRTTAFRAARRWSRPVFLYIMFRASGCRPCRRRWRRRIVHGDCHRVTWIYLLMSLLNVCATVQHTVLAPAAPLSVASRGGRGTARSHGARTICCA